VPLFTPSPTSERLFGPAFRAYLTSINAIADAVAADEYVFIPTEVFAAVAERGSVTPGEAGKIFWIETLQRAQLAAILTLGRTAGWVEGARREYDAGALAPFTACVRALVEATGDSCHTLNAVAVTLAENAVGIRRELSGSGVGATSTELEDLLIHFTHARKVPKGEEAPASHNAESTIAYIRTLKAMGLPQAEEFYKALCERMHPAAAGLAHYYVPSEHGFRISFDQDRPAMDAFVGEYEASMHDLLSLAFNPALLTLRVCGAFGIGTSPEALRRIDFSPVALWARVDAGLRAAGLPASCYT